MRAVPWSFIALTAGVILIPVFFASSFWYLNLLLLLPVGAVLYRARDRPDRVWYGICACQPLVIACGLMNIWAGLFVVWMTGGIAAEQLDRLSSLQDRVSLLMFGAGTFLLAGTAQAANHVAPLLALLGAGVCLLVFALTLRDYQFKKRYSGARP